MREMFPMARLRFVLGLATAATVLVASCLGPTEIEVEIRTDACDLLSPVEIFLGDAMNPVATADKCVNGSYGRLELIPSGRPGPVLVTAQAHLKGGTCAKGQEVDCVRSARLISFLSHTKVSIPITLERACISKLCPEMQTCRNGECMPIPNCTMEMTCNDLDAGPDVFVPLDGEADGMGPACLPPFQSKPVPYDHWSFDDPMKTGKIVDSKGICGSAQTAGQTEPSNMGCGDDLAPKTMRVALGCTNDMTFGSTTFRIAFWIRPDSQAAMDFLRKDAVTVGWGISQAQGNLLQVVQFTNLASKTVVIGKLNPNVWNSVEIAVANGTVTSGIINNMPQALSGSVTLINTANFPLVVQGFSGAIDELYWFGQ
jgi:hypothetical protein